MNIQSKSKVFENNLLCHKILLEQFTVLVQLLLLRYVKYKSLQTHTYAKMLTSVKYLYDQN